jgi:hypothetical protein
MGVASESAHSYIVQEPRPAKCGPGTGHMRKP